MQKDKFDEILRSRLASFEKAPPAGAFEKIKNRIGSKPEEKKPIFLLPTYVKYGVAASLAFLFGLFAMNSYWTNNVNKATLAEVNTTSAELAELVETQELTATISENNETIEVSPKNQQASLNKGKVQIQEKEKAIANSNSNAQASTKQSVNTNTKLVITSSPKEEEEPFLFKSDKVVVNVAGVYAQSKIQDPNNISVYSLTEFENETDNGVTVVKVDDEYSNTRFESDGSHIGYKGFWFGPNVSFESRGIAKNHFMGNGIGIDFGYDFSPKIGLQTGIRFNMLYKDFKLFDTDGKEYHELVDFSNFTVPVAIKFKKSYFASKVERPVSFNTYLGMDYSRMLKVDKNALGAHIGMEYDIFLRPEMMITIGARGGMSSILNYNPSQAYLQDKYRRVNYNLGVYAALRFVSSRR